MTKKFSPFQSNVFQRELSFHDKIMQEQQVLKEEAELERTRKEEESQFKNSDLSKHIKTSAYLEKQEMLNDIRLKEEAIVELLQHSFADILFESILLDEKGDQLIEDCKESSKLIFESGLVGKKTFVESGSVTMQELFGICEGYAEQFLAASTTEEFEELKTSFTEDVERKAITDKISNAVKDKVTDVVKTEKDIAEQNEKQLNIDLTEGLQYKRKERPSLFNSLNQSRVKKFLENDTQENLNMEQIFAESIVGYTFLETLNTTKLLKMDRNATENLVSVFMYK